MGKKWTDSSASPASVHANILAACTRQSLHHIDSCTSARFSHLPQLRFRCWWWTALTPAFGVQHLLAPPPTRPPPRTLLPLADSWLTWSGQGRRRKRVRWGIFSVFAVPVFVCVKQRWVCPPGVQRYEPKVGVRRIGFDVLPPAGYGFNNIFSLPGSHILTFGQQGCKSHCDLPQVTIWLKGSATCFPQVTITITAHSNK